MDKIPFRSMLKRYIKRAKEIEEYLSKKPGEWGKFQSEFNTEVNRVFRNIMDFEKENLTAGYEDKVYKLKRIFINRIRKIFVRGKCIDWSLRKPFGYSGDFKITDDIYQNNPSTTGFDRLFDNYFQMSAISIAVRNRKADLKRFITDFVERKKNKSIRIMDLASGSAREIKELLEGENKHLFSQGTFDCYDFAPESIDYAKQLLKNAKNVNFFQRNAIKLAFKKDIHKIVPYKYDLIYSNGLYPYLDERVAVRLVNNLRKLFREDTAVAMFAANVRNKYSNPSVHFMEWVGDWNLIYRDEDEFSEIFLKSGFKKNELKIKYEQQGIMQYITVFR